MHFTLPIACAPCLALFFTPIPLPLPFISVICVSFVNIRLNTPLSLPVTRVFSSLHHLYHIYTLSLFPCSSISTCSYVRPFREILQAVTAMQCTPSLSVMWFSLMLYDSLCSKHDRDHYELG